MGILDKELETFKSQEDYYIKYHLGEYVVIKDDTLLGYFKTWEEAYEKGMDVYYPNPFLIKEIYDTKDDDDVIWIDIGYEYDGGQKKHVWIKKENVRDYIENLRKQIKQKHYCEVKCPPEVIDQIKELLKRYTYYLPQLPWDEIKDVDTLLLVKETAEVLERMRKDI